MGDRGEVECPQPDAGVTPDVLEDADATPRDVFVSPGEDVPFVARDVQPAVARQAHRIAAVLAPAQRDVLHEDPALGDAGRGRGGEAGRLDRGLEEGHAVMAQGEGQSCIEQGAIRGVGLGHPAPELICHGRAGAGIVNTLPGGIAAERLDDRSGLGRVQRRTGEGGVAQQDIEFSQHKLT